MKNIFGVLLLANLASCSSLNSAQKSELKEWQANNLEVQEKSPGTAAGLNVILGLGDFYNENYGLGVANLLTWPLSILWAPVGGATGAEEANYYSTKRNVDQLEKNKKITQTNIDEALMLKKISEEERIVAYNKVKAMDLKEFKNPYPIEELVTLRNPASKN